MNILLRASATIEAVDARGNDVRENQVHLRLPDRMGPPARPRLRKTVKRARLPDDAPRATPKPPKRRACPNGHAYTPDNTYYNRSGYAACRACRTQRNKDRGLLSGGRVNREIARTVCIYVTLADLAGIDAAAKKAQMTRSRWLAQASKHFAVKVFG